MRILIVCDQPPMALTLKAILEMNGCDARTVDAVLAYELTSGVSTTSYSPEMEKRILDEAEAFQPDWIWMMLQGHITRQVDTLAKGTTLRRPRLFLFSGHPHTAELERARKELGLSFTFKYVPFSAQEMLNVLTTEK